MTDTQSIEAEARAAVGGGLARNASTRMSSGSAVPEAIMFADDRLDRLAYGLDELDRVVDTLTEKVTPILTAGQPHPLPPAAGTDPQPGSPEDTRSEVARRVSGLGVRADTSADRIGAAIQRIGALIDHLEV